MAYEFGSLQIKKSSIKPIGQAELISRNLEQQRGIFGTQKLLTQEEIKGMVPPELQRQMFELALPNGPYRVTYEESGEHALVCSAMSHVSLIRLEDMKCEFERDYQTNTTAQAFLANAELQAYGRHNCVSVMNFEGMELHRLRRDHVVADLTYLRRHMLLADASASVLTYTDITSGESVAELRGETAFKRIAQDPATAIIAATSENSKVVKAFAPALQHPLFAVDCGEMAQTCQFDQTGRYLVSQCSSGMHVFDIRKTKEEVCFIECANVRDLALSETGKLAALLSEGVYIGDLEAYLALGRRCALKASLLQFHHVSANFVAFRPYFDNLGLSQNDGIQQILVPGAGSAEFDTFDANFYAGTHTRNEQLIRQQLDKLPWDLIGQADALSKVHKPTTAERVKARNSEVLKQMEAMPKAKTQREKLRIQSAQRRIESRIQEEIDKTEKGAPSGADRFIRNE